MNNDLLYNNKYVNINSLSFSESLDRHKLSFQQFIKNRHNDLTRFRNNINVNNKQLYSEELESINNQPKINNKYNVDDLQNTNNFNENAKNTVKNSCIMNNPKKIISLNDIRYNVNYIESMNDVTIYLNIDSRDRDLTKYVKQNNYKISFNALYTYIYSVKLISSIFVNTTITIRATPNDISNNNIYWQIEDPNNPNNAEGNITYQATLNEGIYTKHSLPNEIMKQMNRIKRTGAPGRPFNNIIIELDTVTEILTFKSTDITILNNPFSTIQNSKRVTVTHGSHGFITGDKIYVDKATGVGGIDNQLINGSHIITVPIVGNQFDEDHYYFDLDDVLLTATGQVISSGTVATTTENNKGGQSVEVGKSLSLKLRFSLPNTPVTILGFPVTDTPFSQIIQNVVNIKNINISHSYPSSPAIIYTTTKHGLKKSDRVFIENHIGTLADNRINDAAGYYIRDIIDDYTFTLPIDILTGDTTTSVTIETGIINNLSITNGGSGYTSDPTVQFTDTTGINASAIAYRGISNVNITNGGINYSNPTITFSNPISGTDVATGSIIFSKILQINVINGGSDYNIPPTINISDSTGVNATAVASISDGVITSITITNPGSGYSNTPFISFVSNSGTGAIATAVVNFGVINEIIITNSGSKYDNNASFTISDPTGSNFSGTTTVDKVTLLELTNGGSDYVNPTVNIIGTGNNATATAFINGLSSITIINNDFEYPNKPSISIIDSGGGTGAVIDALYNGISNINIISPGVNYNNIPTVSIITAEGDNGLGATAIATVSNGNITSITVTNVGSNYKSVPIVEITPHSNDENASGAVAQAVISQNKIEGFNIINKGHNYTSATKILLHGYGGRILQNRLNRPVTISNQPYIYMCSDALSNKEGGALYKENNIDNIFAKLLLVENAGNFMYNSFITKPIYFKDLKSLNNVDFKFLTVNNELVEFNNIEHSFILEITQRFPLFN